MLWLLARRAGEIVTRDERYMQIRGVPHDGLDRGMDVHVSRLRQKLEMGGWILRHSRECVAWAICS